MMAPVHHSPASAVIAVATIVSAVMRAQGRAWAGRRPIVEATHRSMTPAAANVLLRISRAPFAPVGLDPQRAAVRFDPLYQRSGSMYRCLTSPRWLDSCATYLSP